MKLLIYNRQLNLINGRVEILRKGEYNHAETGLVEVVDEQALTDVLAAFNRDAAAPNFAGILVDEDHFSYDPATSSGAMAWVMTMNRAGDSLFGGVELTDIGKPAVEGKRFKFQSPVLEFQPLAGNRVRPTRLDTLAFTNKPVMKNLAAIALLNRGSDAAPTQPKGAEKMKQLLSPVLGVAVDAADAAFIEAITKLKNRADLVTGLTAERDTLLGEQVDRDLTEFKDVIADPVEMKKQLLANRAGSIAFLKSVKAPAKPALHNRTGKKMPAATADDSTGQQALADQQHAATLTIKNRDKSTYQAAREVARAEKPELFVNAETTQENQ